MNQNSGRPRPNGFEFESFNGAGSIPHCGVQNIRDSVNGEACRVDQLPARLPPLGNCPVLIGHGHLLDCELSEAGEGIEDGFESAFLGDEDELVYIKEEHPFRLEFRDVAFLHPRLQNLHHRRVDAAGVVDHEMRLLAQHSDVVRQPFPDSLRIQIPVQRRAAVEVIVFGRRLERFSEIGEIRRGFHDGLEGVGGVEVSVAAAVGGCVDQELAAAVGVADGERKSAVHHHGRVYPAVPPVGEDLLAGDEKRILRLIRRDPLALVARLSEHVERLRS
nr:hypothetical protein TorRG33x02_203710 [Ipomoea batatas]